MDCNHHKGIFRREKVLSQCSDAWEKVWANRGVCWRWVLQKCSGAGDALSILSLRRKKRLEERKLRRIQTFRWSDWNQGCKCWTLFAPEANRESFYCRQASFLTSLQCFRTSLFNHLTIHIKSICSTTLIWLCWGEALDMCFSPWFINNDFPLSSSSPEDYACYSKNLHNEYGTDSYKKDRLKMLKTLLIIPFIYSNANLRKKFEATARHNVQAEIEELQHWANKFNDIAYSLIWLCVQIWNLLCVPEIYWLTNKSSPITYCRLIDRRESLARLTFITKVFSSSRWILWTT